MAPTLAEIRADHVVRYSFAAGRVSGDVLDAACGCGYGSAILADAGCRVRGIDNSPEAIAYAQAHWSRKDTVFTVGDVCHSPGRYDHIVCFETLEHVAEDAALLRQFARIAPRLIVSVPNELEVPHAKANNPFHFRHYTPRELEALLRGTGWAVRDWWGQRRHATELIQPGTEGATTVIACCERL